MFETQEVTISHLSQFSHHNHILVPRLGAVLLGGHHVAVQRHDRLAVPAVCRVLLELLTDSEQRGLCLCLSYSVLLKLKLKLRGKIWVISQK